jgi:aminotransferase
MALALRVLDEAHVVTIPGAAFGRTGEGCLRLSFGSVSEDDLDEGLDRLSAFLSR